MYNSAKMLQDLQHWDKYRAQWERIPVQASGHHQHQWHTWLLSDTEENWAVFFPLPVHLLQKGWTVEEQPNLFPCTRRESGSENGSVCLVQTHGHQKWNNMDESSLVIPRESLKGKTHSVYPSHVYRNIRKPAEGSLSTYDKKASLPILLQPNHGHMERIQTQHTLRKSWTSFRLAANGTRFHSFLNSRYGQNNLSGKYTWGV